VTTLRMTWPILDTTAPLADLLDQASTDARITLGARRADGPPTWRIEPAKPRGLALVMEVPVADGRLDCGTHAAYNRHRAHGETPCEACRVAERDYNRAAKRASRERRTA
jgi:hypothetical protein